MKLLFVTIVLFISYLSSCPAQDNTKPQPKPIYPVRVEVKEIQNRTLECTVREHKVLIDQPKGFGADDKAPTPPELLAASLGGCVVSTMQFVAYQRKIEISNIRVVVEGEIDFSTAVGMCCSERAGFDGLKISISFDSKLSEKEKQEFIEKVFQVGAVIDNIMNKTSIKYEIAK